MNETRCYIKLKTLKYVKRHVIFSPFPATPPCHTQFELPTYTVQSILLLRSGNLIIILLNRRVVGSEGGFWSLKSPVPMMEETCVDKTRIDSAIYTVYARIIPYRRRLLFAFRRRFYCDNKLYVVYLIFYVTCGAPVAVISRILSTQLLYNMYIYI